MSRVNIDAGLDPQMRAVLAKQAELSPAQSDYKDVPLAQVRDLYDAERRYWNADGPDLPRVEDRGIPGPFGEIPVRAYYPAGAGPVPALVYLHGGGWIVGNPGTHDKITRLLALDAGCAVISVDYRLAPEHKFPTQLEECLAVVRHLAANAGDWGLDGGRLAIGGDSAGANMSLAACLDLRNAGEHLVQAGLLYYGAFGLRDSGSRRKYGGVEDGMSAADLAYYKACLVRSPEDLLDPRIDLLSRDMAGLPPLLVAAAEYDPLYDDSQVLADLLADAGVAHRLTVYQGVLHGFLHYSRLLDKASAAIGEGAAWLHEIFTAEAAARTGS